VAEIISLAIFNRKINTSINVEKKRSTSLNRHREESSLAERFSAKDREGR